MELRYTIYKAWVAFLSGEAFSADLFLDLMAQGVCPEKLFRAFEDGLEPPFWPEDIEGYGLGEMVFDDDDDDDDGSLGFLIMYDYLPSVASEVLNRG